MESNKFFFRGSFMFVPSFMLFLHRCYKINIVWVTLSDEQTSNISDTWPFFLTKTRAKEQQSDCWARTSIINIQQVNKLDITHMISFLPMLFLLDWYKMNISQKTHLKYPKFPWMLSHRSSGQGLHDRAPPASRCRAEMSGNLSEKSFGT